MITKKYYIIALLGGMFIAFTAHAGLLSDEVAKNKKLLNAQMQDLPKVGSQLLSTGEMLHNQLINGINSAEEQLRKQGKLLVIPQSIFNDPFGELAKQSPDDDFVQFIRKPEFRDAFNKLWSTVLQPFGASSLPDILNNTANLLNLVQGKLVTIKGKFNPIILDLNAYVNLTRAQNDIPGTKKIDFNFVVNNRGYVKSAYKKATNGGEFDSNGIYSGLDGALKEFDQALIELNKLEKLFKALGL